MDIHFFKYQGTGNDFIILDNRDNAYSFLDTAQVNFLCNRKFGIGADGLMLLNKHNSYDFEMVYYNADGKEGSMCGNGGRCLVKFAYDSGIKKTTYHFMATDGPHEAEIDLQGIVRLKMKDVQTVKNKTDHFILDTGSPHYVQFVQNLQKLNVKEEGKKIRYSDAFADEGINVNFVETVDDHTIFVRTYERGVENETLSCGTGVTAAALVSAHNENSFNEIDVRTTGGNLSVEFDLSDENQYSNIWLCGPAEFVFKGEIGLE
ncbi:diaminopimelate epimerase [Agriterribacter humi]|uniref:diaminopimelate epimerase n=1 Tax=Agriterribacter humi TaxID=1104781 RepID=UPI0012652D8C|nr:diaminopimelate epimerase [Agriterribacter humi]